MKHAKLFLTVFLLITNLFFNLNFSKDVKKSSVTSLKIYVINLTKTALKINWLNNVGKIISTHPIKNSNGLQKINIVPNAVSFTISNIYKNLTSSVNNQIPEELYQINCNFVNYVCAQIIVSDKGAYNSKVSSPAAKISTSITGSDSSLTDSTSSTDSTTSNDAITPTDSNEVATQKAAVKFSTPTAPTLFAMSDYTAKPSAQDSLLPTYSEMKSQNSNSSSASSDGGNVVYQDTSQNSTSDGTTSDDTSASS